MKYMIMIMVLMACQGCSSLSFKADKASIEVEGKKAEIEGLDVKAVKSDKPE